MKEWPSPDCRANFCPGCFGVQYRCGHGFMCARDPKAINHRCISQYNYAIWTIFLTICTFALVLAIENAAT